MTRIRYDPCVEPDPRVLWGTIDGGKLTDPKAINPATERHKVLAGEGPADKPCRELWTVEGDDWYQMRTELGRNWWQWGMNGTQGGSMPGPGTFMLYHEGICTRTSMAVRLGDDWPLDAKDWAAGGGLFLQEKQTQPNGDVSGPALTLGAYGGRFRLVRFWNEVWSCPAEVGKWYRIEMRVMHSASPLGWTEVSVNRGEARYESARLDGATLSKEPEGPIPGKENRYPKGAPLPNHLRVGIYHAKDTAPRSLRVADIAVWSG